MSMLKNKWAIAALLLAACTIMASMFAVLYYTQCNNLNAQYNDLSNQYNSIVQDYNQLAQQVGNLTDQISVKVGFDYGNGTRTWVNNTIAGTSETFLNLTKRIATVTETSGFVTAINGVSFQGNYYWMAWSFNSTSSEWSLLNVGSGDYKVTNGEILLWYYQDTSVWPPNPPV